MTQAREIVKVLALGVISAATRFRALSTNRVCVLLSCFSSHAGLDSVLSIENYVRLDWRPENSPPALSA